MKQQAESVGLTVPSLHHHCTITAPSLQVGLTVLRTINVVECLAMQYALTLMQGAVMGR